MGASRTHRSTLNPAVGAASNSFLDPISEGETRVWRSGEAFSAEVVAYSGAMGEIRNVCGLCKDPSMTGELSPLDAAVKVEDF